MQKFRNLISSNSNATRISASIDIGSHGIKVIVSEANTNEERAKPKIIGVGYALSKSIRRGYITNIEEVAESIREAVSMAEKSSNYRITKAYLGIGGLGLFASSFSGSTELGAKETEITSANISSLTDEIEENLPDTFTINRKVMHAVPLSFKVDGKPVIGKAVGMYGKTLECKSLFVACLSQHIDDFIEAVELAGIEVDDVAASPLAASLATVNKAQQMAGLVLINIGAETTSVSVFENGAPMSIEVIPLGSGDITNDIALGFKISLEEAERIKIARPETIPYPRKKLEEIISARLSDIFDLVETHLKKIGRSSLLPAGAVITGGGALSPFIEQVAKTSLKLPIRKAGIKFDGKTALQIKDGTWAVAYGLTILGINSSSEDSSPINIFKGRLLKKAKLNLVAWIKKILP
ncbi:MAG: cell division protein FtsA [Candidatus Paceibacterota bacterium]